MPVYVQRHRGTNRPGAFDNTGRMQSDERVKVGKGRGTNALAWDWGLSWR